MSETKKPKTPELLLSTAKELILKDGFKAVSVERIIEKAGVSKGTFFYHFNSKETLAVKLFDEFVEQRSRHIIELMQKAKEVESDPLEQFLYFLEHHHEDYGTASHLRGCLIGSFTYQLMEEVPVLKSRAEHMLSGWVKLFANQIRTIEAKYGEKSNTPESLATMLFSILQGSMITSRINDDWLNLKRNIEHYRHYINLLYKD